MPETVDAKPQFPFAAEMKRKALHLFALVIPIGIILIKGPIDVIILASLAVIALAADFARVRVEWVKRAVETVFAPLMRPTELEPIGGRVVINGATWMCASAAICALVFPPVVAASALAILMVGDAAAAIIGRRFGRHHYAWSPKTIEGTLAFVVTGVLAAMPFAALVQPGVGAGAVMIAAVVGAALEASPLPINDNLKVPLAAGAVMLLLG